MKKTVLLIALVLTGINAFGQGTLLFNNKYASSTPPIDAPVYIDTIGGTKVDGSAYLGQLYVGATAGSLVAVGTPVAFRAAGPGAGYITGGDVAVPGLAAGTAVVVEFRAWESAKGSSYDLSMAAGGRVGKSAQLNLTLGGTGSPPGPGAPLVGLTSFAVTVVPEPSTIALGLLGAAGLFLRRRK